jgi:preprotein translocase subunit SecE
MFQRLIQYFKEVKLELGRVNWPTREQTIKYTTIIIVVSLAVAFFLGGLDYLFSWILNKFVL